jgi:hypothetical protein
MTRPWPVPPLTLLLLLSLGGCLPSSASPLSPEAAVSACEGPTALALRARFPGFQSVVLAPAATSRVERRSTRVGSQPVGLVVAGRGTTRAQNELRPVRYLCLVAPDGEAVFVDVETIDGVQVLAECGPPGTPPVQRRGCLAGLLRDAERGLAEAEARAVARARGTGPRAARSTLEEPAVTSIGAWRVYREAECARRAQGEGGTAPAELLLDACRIELTRARADELSG